MAWLCFGLWQLGYFQKQERIWISALDRARLLADGGLCVCALDTELLGHWWCEGPLWLAAVLEQAASAGLKMPSTKLLIFGNPKAGTPLMLASPGAALDLPLKILVAEDTTDKVWISYNSPSYLQARHNLPPDLLPNIAVIEALAVKAAE